MSRHSFSVTIDWLLRGRRPDHSLILLAYRRQPLVNKALHTVPFVRFSGVQISFRVAGDHVNAVELTGLASAVTKRRQLFESIPTQNMNELVLTISYVQI